MEIQLIDAKKYVELEFEHTNSYSKTLKKVSQTNHSYDFIDAIQFSRTSGVIARGILTNSKRYRVQRFSRAIDQWYYLFVSATRTTKETVVTVPLRDYIFRYDRGAFWVGKYAFDLFGVPFTRFRRFVLNPILHTRELYKALQDSGASQQHIVQDLCVPLEQAELFLEYLDKETGTYPLWICPVKPDLLSPLLCNAIDTPVVINIGVWGERITDRDTFIALNRSIESELMRVGGKKWMYAHTYYAADEFWRIYDQPWYDALRKKYHATSLPNMYQKVSVTKKFNINAKRAVYRTIFRRAALRFEDPKS